MTVSLNRLVPVGTAGGRIAGANTPSASYVNLFLGFTIKPDPASVKVIVTLNALSVSPMAL
jgi:hypothetical protein